MDLGTVSVKPLKVFVNLNKGEWYETLFHSDHCSPLLYVNVIHPANRWLRTCVYCNGADETAEHLVLHCPAHNQVRRESWPNLHYQSDPRRLRGFLDRIGELTRPPDREWERGSRRHGRCHLQNLSRLPLVSCLKSCGKPGGKWNSLTVSRHSHHHHHHHMLN